MDDACTTLCSFLQLWRGRVAPSVVGLAVNGPRRTQGCGARNLAGLAGVSVDYLVRLEQGRAAKPSVEVLASLARALQLSDENATTCIALPARNGPAPSRSRPA